MTPSPLAPPGPPALPVTPAAPGPPDTARRAFDDRQAASGAADFPGLMAVLAAVLAPPPSPPVVTAGGEAPATVADGPAADDQPSPSSLEALVSALAQQASGLSQ